uniref:Small cysteine-rich protein 1 n=1 Tax=Acropora millepora TaxID=45264 RepID=SCR1G_ACRMI|nr:RecName: Full=Small cysteine-rich protein 1; Short=Amil-SCRiP1; Short=SCRiP1; Flags: Precursor [Acropora millepora]DAA06482.1 TPA_inf: small cysteine-rich protein 1 [Acropora millepora]
MDVRFRLCLFLVILVIVANANVIKEPEKRFHPNLWRPPRCDWPHGVCSYIRDRCAPDTPFPCGPIFACPLPTNKCCCRRPYLPPWAGRR